tara:strand:+ start:260 stop:412 length:153 start_codon:yes stop_codon:yes gene_type:complete
MYLMAIGPEVSTRWTIHKEKAVYTTLREAQLWANRLQHKFAGVVVEEEDD